MCKRRLKETTPTTPEIPVPQIKDREIDVIARKMGLRPDTRTPEERARDIEARNNQIIENSVDGVIKS
jgi:hypothetical protein